MDGVNNQIKFNTMSDINKELDQDDLNKAFPIATANGQDDNKKDNILPNSSVEGDEDIGDEYMMEDEGYSELTTEKAKEIINDLKELGVVEAPAPENMTYLEAIKFLECNPTLYVDRPGWDGRLLCMEDGVVKTKTRKHKALYSPTKDDVEAKDWKMSW